MFLLWIVAQVRGGLGPRLQRRGDQSSDLQLAGEGQPAWVCRGLWHAYGLEIMLEHMHNKDLDNPVCALINAESVGEDWREEVFKKEPYASDPARVHNWDKVCSGCATGPSAQPPCYGCALSSS